MTTCTSSMTRFRRRIVPKNLVSMYPPGSAVMVAMACCMAVIVA
jgi:hypothetical protein